MHVEQESDELPFLASSSFPGSHGFFSYVVDRDAETTRKLYPDKVFEDFETRKTYIKKLCQAGILDYPTQSLVADYLEEPTEVLHKLYLSSCSWGPTVKTAEITLQQGCHIAATILAVLHPEYKIVTGVSDTVNRHSWVVSPKGIVFEPTPLIRDRYYGYVFDREAFIRVRVKEALAAINHDGRLHKHRTEFLEKAHAQGFHV